MHNSPENEASSEEAEDTIYGIRTNVNAVSEYNNLLISFIEKKNFKAIGKKIKRHMDML